MQLKARPSFLSRHIVALFGFALTAGTCAQQCSYCTKAGVDMPVSLAVGTVRTPEFIAKHRIYWIAIQSQWLLPTENLRCKMGFGVVPPSDQCKSEIVLDGNWRVLEGDRVVAQGAIERISPDFDAGKDYLRRYIGKFNGESKHKYVVEVTLSEDGSSLNVTNPRLIVAPPEFSF